MYDKPDQVALGIGDDVTLAALDLKRNVLVDASCLQRGASVERFIARQRSKGRRFRDRVPWADGHLSSSRG